MEFEEYLLPIMERENVTGEFIYLKKSLASFEILRVIDFNIYELSKPNNSFEYVLINDITIRGIQEIESYYLTEGEYLTIKKYITTIKC